MITFFVTAAHPYTIQWYLDSWGRSLKPTIRIVPYEDLPAKRTLSGGTYIFSDLERLTDEQLASAAALWDQLSSAGTGFRLLNNPHSILLRYGLLRKLHQVGRNEFNVYRAADEDGPSRFPVFLRLENAHDGSLTPLLHNPAQLREAVEATVAGGVDVSKLLIVEFCDTSSGAAFYQVRSVFRVGDRIFPHHMHFENQWVVKNSYEDRDQSHAAAEMAFLRSREAARVLPAFRLANVEYGRMDYAYRGGAIQVWEINTNPVVLRPPDKGVSPERLPGVKLVARRLKAAFHAIDLDLYQRRRVRIRWDASPIRATRG
jgi:hypothetical protein